MVRAVLSHVLYYLYIVVAIFLRNSLDPHMLDTTIIIYKAALFMNLSSVTEHRVLNVLQMCHHS
jgi:hypothetical protein